VSALLAAFRPRVGYQPTLATDMGALQELITTTTKGFDHFSAASRAPPTI